MKRQKLQWLPLLLVLTLVLSLSITVMAASRPITKDGITAQFSSDKEVYAEGETVHPVLSVTNNSGKKTTITAQFSAPAGITLGMTSVSSTVLEAGETYQTPVPDPVEPQDPQEPAEPGDPQSGNTVWLIVGIVGAVLAVAGIVVFVILRKRSRNAVLSILLCAATVFGLGAMAIPAQAADLSDSMFLSHSITVGEKSVSITAIVSYVIEGGADKEPEKLNITPTTYYVSPTGSDANDGSEASPWATFGKAARTANAGDTVIFEDGTYYETAVVTFANSGNAEYPITFKARNQHKAVVLFAANIRSKEKMLIEFREYITIQGFDITQVERDTAENTVNAKPSTRDILLGVYDCNNVSIIGNKFHNVYEEGLKCGRASGLLIDGNIFYDYNHEGVDFVNVHDSIICNNEFDGGETETRVAIMCKGGSSNIQIFNNYIHSTAKMQIAIGLGNSTTNLSAYGYSKEDYEAYNMVAFNNIIHSEVRGRVRTAVHFYGSRDCAAFNNLIMHAYQSVVYEQAKGTKKDWEWDPHVENPVFKNNIIFDNTTPRIHTVTEIDAGSVKNIQSDYNLYYIYNKDSVLPDEPNSIFVQGTTPKESYTVDQVKEMVKASAKNAGIEISKFVGLGGFETTINYDANYMVREAGAWDIGPWEYDATEGPVEGNRIVFQDPKYICTEVKKAGEKEKPLEPMPADGTVLYEDTFDSADTLDNWLQVMAIWELNNGTLEQVDELTNKGVALYTQGIWWSNYEYSADIKAPSGKFDQNTGILFRSDKKSANMYGFRFCNYDQIEFCMWNRGKFNSLKIWDYDYEPGKTYTLKVKAVDDVFTFYINDQKIETLSDTTHRSGTVGLYTYGGNEGIPQLGAFDNLMVISRPTGTETPDENPTAPVTPVKPPATEPTTPTTPSSPADDLDTTEHVALIIPGTENNYYYQSDASIASGGKYVILHSKGASQMSQGSKSESITWSEVDKKIYTASNAFAWTVEYAGNGAYYLYYVDGSGNRQYLATSTSTAKLQLVTEPGDAAKFNITARGTASQFYLNAVTPGAKDRVAVSIPSSNNGDIKLVDGTTMGLVFYQQGKGYDLALSYNSARTTVTGTVNLSNYLFAAASDSATGTAAGTVTIKEVQWSSSDSNVFTVDSAGQVTAVASGTAKITAKITKVSIDGQEFACDYSLVYTVATADAPADPPRG